MQKLDVGNIKTDQLPDENSEDYYLKKEFEKAYGYSHAERKNANKSKNLISSRFLQVKNLNIIVVYELEARQKGADENDQKAFLWGEIHI